LNINIVAIIAMIKHRYHYTISYKKARLGKQLAMADLFGDWDASYRFLPKCMVAMEASNPGSVVCCIEAFKYCRSVICIDATHLYQKYKGKLLV
ncbi:hypothetical protein CFOL_v3_08094, partial [Cephalotus follicularis]